MSEAVVGSPNELASVRISCKGAGRIESGNPWVCTGDAVERGGAADSVVRVLDQRGSFLQINETDTLRAVDLCKGVERGLEILKRNSWKCTSDVIERGGAAAGSVRGLDQQRTFLGLAHFNGSSQIHERVTVRAWARASSGRLRS